MKKSLIFSFQAVCLSNSVLVNLSYGILAFIGILSWKAFRNHMEIIDFVIAICTSVRDSCEEEKVKGSFVNTKLRVEIMLSKPWIAWSSHNRRHFIPLWEFEAYLSRTVADFKQSFNIKQDYHTFALIGKYWRYCKYAVGIINRTQFQFLTDWELSIMLHSNRVPTVSLWRQC